MLVPKLLLLERKRGTHASYLWTWFQMESYMENQLTMHCIHCVQKERIILLFGLRNSISPEDTNHYRAHAKIPVITILGQNICPTPKEIIKYFDNL